LCFRAAIRIGPPLGGADKELSQKFWLSFLDTEVKFGTPGECAMAIAYRCDPISGITHAGWKGRTTLENWSLTDRLVKADVDLLTESCTRNQHD
jgi:hypothetical protein